MDKRKLFTEYPGIGPDELVLDTHFYKWLDQNNVGDAFLIEFIRYLVSFGFEPGKDIISSEQLEMHKSVFSHYWWLKLKGEQK